MFVRIAAFASAAATALAADLAWTVEGGTRGARFANVSPVGSGKTGFTRVAPSESGITFSNHLAEERGITNQVYYSASGVAIGDVNGDRLPDLYFASLNGDNRLYLNLGGFRFKDVTASAGVGIGCAGQPSTGVVLADVDGDGDTDLLVSSIGNGVRLFSNDGTGSFRETTGGLASNHSGMTLALADIDGDRDLDLYAANYRRDTFQDEVNVRFRVRTVGGQPQIVAVNDQPVTSPQLTNRYYVDARGAVQENGEADVLYLNDGKGGFTPVSWTGGRFINAAGEPLAAAPLDWGLSAMFRDINGDGAPDLYVCNDGDSPDRIWINDGKGRFREFAGDALRETSFSSMGVDFADINRDGHDDFFVTDMMGYEHATRHSLLPTRIMSASGDRRPAVPRNTLFLNRGDSTWAEIAQLAHVDASDWTWCPAFLDVDLDGYDDLLITTGLEKSLRNADDRARIDALRRQGRLTRADFLNVRRTMRRLDVPNFAFRNRGDLTFEVASQQWRFDARESSHGMALGDLDNDGDVDVVVSCLNAQPLVYRNDATAPRIAVTLKGAAANAAGVGARITLRAGDITLAQEVISGGRYLSCDQPLRVFAAEASPKWRIEVTWRAGTKSIVENALPNRIYEIDESFAIAPKVVAPWAADPLFADAGDILKHRHAEMRFDDFARQPMLPRRLTGFGPGLCWMNYREDAPTLIVGAGQGSPMAMFSVQTNNRVALLNIPELAGNAVDDIAGLACWPMHGGTNVLAFAQSTYKSGTTNAVFVFAISPNAVRRLAAFSAWDSSPGPVAASDMDGDGDLDLFVGGRVIPGRYPAPASSRVYRNQGGDFVFDAKASKMFEKVGLVNGAVFTDLDGKGTPELVLACEWDCIKIFNFVEGTPRDTTSTWGLQAWRGWWQGITAGDFDGDGRMDLMAGNWGRNHRFSRFMAEPVRIYYSEMEADGAVKCFEAYRDFTLQKYVPARHWDTMVFRFPFLQERVRGFTDFSTRSVEELFGERLAQLATHTASTADSMVLLNRGGRFDARPLPIEAQLAPVFGIGVADFDGNGTEDAFLAQNFSGTDSETSPLTAGRGVLLLGDGKGAFRMATALESGVAVYGDSRGVAVADWNNDGRPDLGISQNGNETRLFRNARGLPGLRVVLENPTGAQLQAVYEDGRTGPSREIRAGGGWLSQDSSAVILAKPIAIREVVVRRPGESTLKRVAVGKYVDTLRIP